MKIRKVISILFIFSFISPSFLILPNTAIATESVVEETAIEAEEVISDVAVETPVEETAIEAEEVISDVAVETPVVVKDFAEISTTTSESTEGESADSFSIASYTNETAQCEDMTIDNFMGTGDFSKFLHRSSDSYKIKNQITNNGSIGGQLDAYYVGLPVSFGSALNLVGAYNSINAEILNSAHSNSKILFIWDGVDNDILSIDYDGLNHTNLSFNNERQSIRFNYFSDFTDNKEVVLTFTVFTDGDNASILTKSLYGANNQMMQGEIRLSDFKILRGSGARMTDIGAITLEIDATSRNGHDFGIGNLKLSCMPVEVNTPPQITLVGSNPLNLSEGDVFVDPKATAIDAEDGDLTNAIVVTGSVGTTTGTYTLNYSVTDSKGLSASTTRVVVVEPHTPHQNITIVATAIKCFDEADLPNWGNGGPDITATTASDYLASHIDRCYRLDDWGFQWGNQDVTNPGDSYLWDAGAVNGWTIFGPTNEDGIATVNIPLQSSTTEIRVREMLEAGFIPFTYEVNGDNSNPVSAEFYCNNDVVNYDNFDFIKNPVAGSTYYCVAFNSRNLSATNTPPQITLVGSNPLNLFEGDVFVDPKATAIDAEDGDLTNAIVVTGSVGTTTGTYTLNYSVTDSKGLSASTTRVVVVSATSTPVVPPVDNNGGNGGGSNVLSSNGGSTSGGGSGGIGGRRHNVSNLISVGEILGASTCSYLRDYLRMDWKNDSVEVLKLQSFLNQFDGASVGLTGVFDAPTFAAVQKFQNKYKSDILTPWGHTAPTGFVYILTKKKINEIYCKTSITLGVVDSNEITSYKAASQSNNVVSVDTQDENEGLRTNESPSWLSNVLNNRDNVLNSDLVVDLKDNASTLSKSVVKSTAMSVFNVFKKIIGNGKYTLLFLVLLIVLIALIKWLFGIKDDDSQIDLISNDTNTKNSILDSRSEDEMFAINHEPQDILEDEEMIIADDVLEDYSHVPEEDSKNN